MTLHLTSNIRFGREADLDELLQFNHYYVFLTYDTFRINVLRVSYVFPRLFNLITFAHDMNCEA